MWQCVLGVGGWRRQSAPATGQRCECLLRWLTNESSRENGDVHEADDVVSTVAPDDILTNANETARAVSSARLRRTVNVSVDYRLRGQLHIVRALPPGHVRVYGLQSSFKCCVIFQLPPRSALADIIKAKPLQPSTRRGMLTSSLCRRLVLPCA